MSRVLVLMALLSAPASAEMSFGNRWADFGPSTGALSIRLDTVGVDTQTLHTEAISPSRVNLSTVTEALAGKQATGSYLVSGVAISPASIDLSTVTTRINDLYTTKLSTGVAVPQNLVNLSTVTTSINDLYAVRLATGVGIPQNLINLSTVTTRIDDLYTTKLSTGVAIPSNLVNLATVTTALNGKIDTGGLAGTASALAANGLNCDPGSYPLGVDAAGAAESCTVAGQGSEGNTYTSSKTFTTHLLAKSSVTASAFFGDASQTTGAVAQNRVDLSTVTTALNLKAALGGATFTGASGITNAAFTATGAGGHIVTGSSVVASALFGDGSQETGAVAQNRVNLSTVTTALGLKADLGGATFTGASGITGVAFTATGAGGNIISKASVTASAFFGDGSQLSGLPAGAEGNTYTSSKTFTSNVLAKASVTASAFFGNGSQLTGLPAGSEGNTYTSSKTFTAQVQVSSGIFANGSMKISPGYGIGVSNTFSTMTPCGPLFFISSNTPTASTATIGTALTIFSTFTLLANTLSVGDSLSVTCLFENKVAPGTPVNGVYLGAQVLGSDAFATASATVEVQTTVTLQQVGKARFLTKAYSQVAAATTYVTVAASVGVSQRAFDATAEQTFNCKASRATGGPINFVYMRVSKSCQ